MQSPTGLRGKTMNRLKVIRRKRNRAASSCGAGFFLMVSCLFFCVTLASAQQVSYKGATDLGTLVSSQTKKSALAQQENQSAHEYSYDPTDKPDPFKSYIAEQESIEEKERRKPKTYLETVDVSQLDLIAIVISGKGSWAMVRDAKGLGFVIRKGTAIGTNEGVVSEIKEEEVIIREKHREFGKTQVKYKDVEKKLLSSL